MKLRDIMSESTSKIVKVSGDRGEGIFKVKIIKRRPDLEYSEFTDIKDEIYECVDIKTGKTVYVVKGAGRAQRDKSFFGEIEPFIDEDDY